MGKACSKCFKTNVKKLDIYKPSISEVQNSRKDSSKNSEDSNNVNAGTNINNMVNVALRDKNNEEEKESKNNNWDNYFSKEQLRFYDKLYDTEDFDRMDTKLIKRFKKGELIGEGSFGKVYQGFDEEQGRLIAIKELDLKRISSKNLAQLNAVELEIDILSKLHHKNIVKYYGVERSENYLHIILEYCIGGSVAKLLETYKTLSEAIIRKYMLQILEGLEYLHCHCIIHRDIKGANILVDRDGICKLSDFGGAKIMEDEIDLHKHSFRGTPNWMAPETVKNLEYTRFSDIWSIGCTVIEMATGEPPWSEFKSPMTVLLNIYNAKEPPKIPQHLSAVLKNFISCCLKIEPRERLNVYQLLRHPFITGDIFTFDNAGQYLENLEFENKFFSEEKEKNTRIYDTLKFSSFNNNNDKLFKRNSGEDLVSPTNINPIIIRSKSPISPLLISKASREAFDIHKKESPTLTPNLKIIKKTEKK